jgi:uncharacterized protein (DUF1330 family)
MDERELLKKILDDLAASVPADQPVVMINLLRYRAVADYPDGREKGSVTGRQAYERYSQLTLPHLLRVGGRLIWRADGRACLIAPPGERWDEALLVRYPSRAAFERMITDANYQAGAIHRTAALEDSRLIATTSPRHIGRLLWWVVALVARFRRTTAAP